jgi:hypothetical protein
MVYGVLIHKFFGLSPSAWQDGGQAYPSFSFRLAFDIQESQALCQISDQKVIFRAYATNLLIFMEICFVGLLSINRDKQTKLSPLSS